MGSPRTAQFETAFEEAWSEEESFIATPVRTALPPCTAIYRGCRRFSQGCCSLEVCAWPAIRPQLCSQRSNEAREDLQSWPAPQEACPLTTKQIISESIAACRYERDLMLEAGLIMNLTASGPRGTVDRLPRETMQKMPQIMETRKQGTAGISTVCGLGSEGLCLSFTRGGLPGKRYKHSGVKWGIERIPWDLLQPSEVPSMALNGHSVGLMWRVHVIGMKGQPEDEETAQGTPQFKPPVFLDVELSLHLGDHVHVDLGHASQEGEGEQCKIRRLVLTDDLAICLEHRRAETSLDCFCGRAVNEASTTSMSMRCAHGDTIEWGTTADYVSHWRTVVELEAVTVSIEEGDSKMLVGVDITWLDARTGHFSLPYHVVSAQGVRVRSLIRGYDGLAEWASAWLCIRQARGLEHEWSAHAAVTDVQLQAKNSTIPFDLGTNGDDDFLNNPKVQQLALAAGAHVVLTFELTPNSPDSAPSGETITEGCVVEYLHKCMRYTFMAMALADVARSPELLHEVVLHGRAPLEVSPSAVDLASWMLNESQEQAVRTALEEPLALIHGPPGTGKTRTAAALAILYAIQNLEEGADVSVLYSTPSNEVANHACLRVQQLIDEQRLIFPQERWGEAVRDPNRRPDVEMDECGMCLTWGCDMVTSCGHFFHSYCLSPAGGKRKRMGGPCPRCSLPLEPLDLGISLLRIYSSEIERADFPVPRKIDTLGRVRMKVREVPTELRQHAMHWRCHGAAPGVVPTPQATQCGRLYAQLLNINPKTSAFIAVKDAYFAALEQARTEELQRADIVFTTCTAVRNFSVVTSLRSRSTRVVRQVIIDEAGQVCEVETLCPLTVAQDLKRIALIGDPRQIRPVVRSPAAMHLGMRTSLLERLSHTPDARPHILTLQYRMHPELNFFPSTFFYFGQVGTDPSVRCRDPGLLAHPERPTEPVPLLFWDCQEEASVSHRSMVRTSSNNVGSHFNPEEALRAVQVAEALARHAKSRNGQPAVALLTWYNAQVAECASLLRGTCVHVASVVSAQGAEWDYVVLSTVRIGHRHLGLVADEHLFNVAITRARLGLCILGNVQRLRGNPIWSALIMHCAENQAITQAPPVIVGGGVSEPPQYWSEDESLLSFTQ